MTIIDVFNKVSVFATTLPGILSFSRGVRGPQGEIVTQQLHDEGAVLVAVLVEGVELSDSIVEGLLSQLTGLVRGLVPRVMR